MAKTASIHVRMDDVIKNDAVKVFDALGISVAEAITMYFKQVSLKKAIPFELTTTTVQNLNIDKVSRYKIDDLNKILDVVPDSVDELWVFGSSVTKYCRPDSDLDICIVGNKISKEDRKTIVHAARRGVDLLDINKKQFEIESSDRDSVFYEVKNKGVMIYKKGEGLVSEFQI